VIYWRRAALTRLPLLLGAGAAALLGFLAGTPYALLSWREFAGGLVYQWFAYNDAPNGHLQGAWPLAGYARFFWGDGLGPPLCLAALAGLALLWRRRRAVALVWLSFALPSLLLHLAMQTHFMQNMLPLLVLCALPAGVAGAAALEWLAARAPRYRLLAAAGMLALLLLPTTAQTLIYVARQARGDTRVQALRWIERNVPPGARIAAELEPIQDAGESRWSAVDRLTAYDMAWYRRQGYAYLVGSSNRWRQWQPPETYRRLAGAAPVAAFGGDSPRHMLGPYLVVYATGLSPADVERDPGRAVGMGGARFLGITLGEPDAEQPQLGLQPTGAFKPGGVLGLRTFWQVVSPPLPGSPAAWWWT
jgi:hypothetical protein